ncbi:MAG: Vms1/Ankzf1 family peptidyl-tRNA hydrolase [Ilumatobacteraceae bacterium]
MARHDDLKDLGNESDWFATITIPTPSNLDNARERFELEWRNARRQFSDGWDEDELAQLDDLVGGLRHGDSASLVIVHARHGSTLIEELEEPVSSMTVHEGPLPRWATVIEARQRVIAHVVVEADRTGAGLTAFDGGSVLAIETVEGETLHIHRGHPGGWSQRRFQQRAENTWESNARQVTDAITELAHKVDAQLIAVAGDIRAQTFILESIPANLADITVRIDVGSPEGIADEVVRQLSTIVAERVTEAAEQVRAGLANDTASIDANVIMEALGQGRVNRLLVHDDATSRSETDQTELEGARLVDQAIAAALATDAEILIVPGLAMMDGPLAATMRW